MNQKPTWHIAYKPGGEAFIDCTWGGEKSPHHHYLIFAPSLDTFDSYDTAGNCIVKGRRMRPKDQPKAVATAPSTLPPPPKPAAAPTNE